MLEGIFDTHAHYDDEAFDHDREEVLASLPENGVSLVVNPGCDERSSAEAVSFAERYDHMFAAVGCHPQEAASFQPEWLETFRGWLSQPKVVAVGEIGLDYHYDDGASPERQKEILATQLLLARETGKPVIIHDRDAHADTLELLSSFPDVRGVVHCYSGSAEMAKQLLKMGWYLGFTGVVTFKNARKALESLAVCPDDRFVIETDSPYLAPVPHRGKRCDSRLLPLVVEKIAEVRGLTPEQVVSLTRENGKRLYQMD